jgi:hypothetical protein
MRVDMVPVQLMTPDQSIVPMLITLIMPTRRVVGVANMVAGGVATMVHLTTVNYSR